MITKDSIKNKKVLLRLDLDIPLENGLVKNDYRLLAALSTLKLCLSHASHTVILGHLGRPEGGIDPSLSLEPIRKRLIELLDQDILLLPSGISPGDRWTGETRLSLMENLRFDPREQEPNRELAHELSVGADIYVYEAFATYRACTSLNLIPEVLPTLTGNRFDQEVSVLSGILSSPRRPSLLLVSGAKQDKLDIVSHLSSRFDTVLLGGALAPKDQRTSDGLDLNDQTIAHFISQIAKAQTVVLNGPLGKYEDGVHDKGTRAIFRAVQDSSAFSVVGGGDTLDAIPSLGLSYTPFGFVSIGGGAMLDFLVKGSHPLQDVLESVKLK